MTPANAGSVQGSRPENLYWITDGVYQSAFLTTTDGVVLPHAKLMRAIEVIGARVAPALRHEL